MEIGVEISLYPLTEDFGQHVKGFVERLRTAGSFKVVTSSLSTQVFGDYDEVIGALSREMRAVLAGEGQRDGKAVLILKVFGPYPAAKA